MEKKNSLYFRYAFNDLFRNKAVNGALVLVLVLSAFLMATGAMVMERLVGSVDQLFDEAKPPHFLQMHKGDYDPDALARFASKHPEIDVWHVQEMLGFDGATIAWNRPGTDESGDLTESLIDNLFVTQNQEFDFLIDETGTVPRPSPGEVYVPVAYQQQFDLQSGDELQIRTDTGVQKLRVHGFVRDAQMASSLSSATRFLVAESDFEQLQRDGGGAPEAIIEYRLDDPSLASDFQSAYEAGEPLPKNGQAVTFQMIRLINAFSDGLVAVALVFMSFLLIAIALINVRFVIRGTLEAEVREIGAMKAIGIPTKAISGLYLAKYSLMTGVACLIGGGGAVIATTLLTRGVQVNYAEAPLGPAAIVVPMVALACVYLFVIAICRGVLRSVRRIEVVGAMVHGSTLDERRTMHRAKRRARRVRRTSLAAYPGGSVNGRLTLLDLRAESGQWVLIPIVFFLAAVLMTLPMNLLSTFTSPQFVTYMGTPESDLRADMQFFDDVDTVRDDVLSTMRDDDRLSDVRAFANVLYETRGDEGWETLRVEVGDYSHGAVEFVHGNQPQTGQIALSVLNAEKYQVSAGDTLTIRQGGQPATMEVSGVYQDVTSGGYTAKMQGDVTTGAVGYVVHANTVDGADPTTVASDYRARFPEAAVIPMREYLHQTLSYVTGAFTSAAILSFAFGIGIAVLITSLFLTLHLTRERRTMATLSAIGFSTDEIITQVRTKTLISVVAGTLLGLVFAATAGESLVSVLISMAGLGIAELAFIPPPWFVCVIPPLVLVSAGYLGSVLLTARLRGADKSSWLNS